MFDDYHRDAALRYFQRGLLLERVNRVDEAVKQYRRAISLNPNLREAQSVLGAYYERQGLLAKAAEAFSMLANLEPSPTSFLHLGRILSASGQIEPAITALHRSLALCPDLFEAYFELARLAFHCDQYVQARDYLLCALDLHPECWETRSLLMLCLLHLGDQLHAAELLQSAPTPWQASSCSESVRSCLRMLERLEQCGTYTCEQTRLYVEQGVFCLSAQMVPQRYFTYPDLALIVRSFLVLLQQYAWQLSCVVALEHCAEPIVRVLSQQTGLPIRRFEQLVAADRALLVIGVGREPELLDVALEQSPCEALTFCVALNWLQQRRFYPDVSGLFVQGICNLPWESELRRTRKIGISQQDSAVCLDRASYLLHEAVMQTLVADCLLPFTPNEFSHYRFAHTFLTP